jgi:tetratricopeptide (TPR) repeat protein
MTVEVELDERIAKCRKILDQDPNSQIFAALADAYRRKGELEKAFQVCQSGLRIHPSYGSAHVVMAKINLDRGLYDWAEAEVKKAQEADGSNRSVELLLAEIHLYKGEYEKAIRLLKRLRQSDPENGHIKKLLEIAERIPEEQKAQIGETVHRAAEPTQVVKAVEGPKDQAERPGPLSTPALLKEALQLPGLTGALFIDQEGLVVESQWQSSMDQTVCGAALADVNQFLDQELVKASFGRVGKVLIESAKSVFYLLTMKKGSFLFVGEASVNLGALRMKVNGLMERHDNNLTGTP